MRGSSRRATKRLQPRAALGERQLAQVLVAVDQEVVGARCAGIVGQQLGVTVLRLSRCCRSPNAATRPSRTTSSSPSSAPSKSQRVDEVGKAAGDVVAGARVEPRDARPSARRRPPARGCRPISIRRHEVGRIERGEVASRRSHGPASPGGTAPDRSTVRLLGAALEPGEQLGVGRLRARARPPRSRPASLSPSAASAGLGQPRRHADAQPPVTSFSSAQRPVSSSASSQPASSAGSSALPSVASSASTTSDERRRRRSADWLPALAGHISATVSARSPT